MLLKEDKETILIVDDTKTNIDVLLGLLDNDYDVVPALSGEKALKIISKLDIKLILLDIMMPDMDGYEICQKLKSDDTTKNIPIIFLTAKTDDNSIQKGFEVGGVDFITKPFRPIELLSRVKSHLNARKYEQLIIDENTKTKQDFKDLKTHVVTKVSKSLSNNTKMQDEYSKIIHEKDNTIQKLNEKLNDNQTEISSLNTRLDKLNDKNNELITKIWKIEKSSFTFEKLLELEIEKTKRFDLIPAFAIIEISNYSDIRKSLIQNSKMDTLIDATQRMISNNMRRYDVVMHVERGIFHLLFSNLRDNDDLSILLSRLTESKKVGHIDIKFNSSITYINKKDSLENVMDRCYKDLGSCSI